VRVLAIEAASRGLNRFPEVRDPAEAATPGVGGRDYLKSRVSLSWDWRGVIPETLAQARFMSPGVLSSVEA
jgi:hypothetical protein